MGAHETKTFKSGNSEAVRLPKGMGFGVGAEVRVERRGDTLTIRPVKDPERAKRELKELIHDLRAIGAPSDGLQAREPFEFPERSGL